MYFVIITYMCIFVININLYVMTKQDDSKAKEKLMSYLEDLNLKDEKKFPNLNNLEFYINHTASEAAVITKVRTLKMVPKQQYYPSYIKEFNENEYTQFICDLVKYGNEKINWEKIVHANEEGKKYRKKEIEKREKAKLIALEDQIKKLEEEKNKLQGELGFQDE